MDQQNQQGEQKSDTWVCLGTCQAVKTDEEYKNGQTACTAEVCTLKGHPFVKGHKSEVTGQNVADNDEMPAGTS